MFTGRSPRDEETRLWQAYVEGVTRIVPQPVPKRDKPPPLRGLPEPRTGGVLDLHGIIAESAYRAFREFVAGGVGVYKFVTVVTGLSGVIRREFDHWIANHPDVVRAELLNGGGAFRVYLRKPHGRKARPHRR